MTKTGRIGTALTVLLMIAASSNAMTSCFAANSAHSASLTTNHRSENKAKAKKDSAVKDEWWKHAVFYEIYPRSFNDSNGDGLGDINGITAKLDYLKKLGVDAIWLTPCYPSPQVDFGYDISNYTEIAPEYGTMADFDKLIAEAKKRNIRIVMDLVMNHTSDKHPWFIESSENKTNPKRDWYIWRDGKNGGPPNNWQSTFGHSAWEFSPKTSQFYYHFFYPQQPDLNYRNPEVKKAMLDVARFWLDKGVAGYRLDAITTLYEDPSLPDNPVKDEKNAFGDPVMEHKYNDRFPEVHDVLRELRSTLNSYNDTSFPGKRVLVGETFGEDVAQISQMYGKNADEIQLPMNFFIPDTTTVSAPEFRKKIADWDNNPAHGWPVYVMSNHDRRRAFSRYADGINNDKIAKVIAAMNLTLRGTPILYYGEEIGMENYDPLKKEEVQDPIGKIGWPKEKGRDGERTPMQWTDSLNAGFSTGHPWVPVALNYPTHNVWNETRDKESLLLFYEKLIALRKANSAFIRGKFVPLNVDDQNVLSYLRQSDSESILVILNMSKTAQTVSFDLKPQGIKAKSGRVLLNSLTDKKRQKELHNLKLEPYQALIIQVR
ncbi:MAG: alpha-glucosidase [Candidatus Obscuribacterales bacterium]|nr:alpha-glucosidase [Candidatus Obscuribacterales bacterium]